ncbi:hypothetical protein SAMN05720467_1123 [Fibrobacter sp. UWB7]|nr:hypothetical protein SAMN05720467_1123 [Fibrobacter sp. UWB7]
MAIVNSPSPMSSRPCAGISCNYCRHQEITGVPCCAGAGSRGTKFSLLFFNRFRFIQELVEAKRPIFHRHGNLPFRLIFAMLTSDFSIFPSGALRQVVKPMCVFFASARSIMSSAAVCRWIAQCNLFCTFAKKSLVVTASRL